MNKPKTTMVVRLADGSVQRFQLPSDGGDDVTLGSRIEKALETQDLVVELGDRLLVIPKHSILTIELTPPPPKLPAVAIRNARLIK